MLELTHQLAIWLPSLLILYQESSTVAKEVAKAPDDWVKSFTVWGTVMAAIVGASYTTYRTLQKVRENARKARDADEAAIRLRIAEAVERSKAEMTTQVTMAKELASHWERMSIVFEKEKLHDRQIFDAERIKFENDLERARADRQRVTETLEEARLKIEEVVDLNLTLQGQINENAKRIRELQERER